MKSSRSLVLTDLRGKSFGTPISPLSATLSIGLGIKEGASQTRLMLDVRGVPTPGVMIF